jgi:hypothetical protein
MPLPEGWDDGPAFDFGSFAEDRAAMRDHLREAHQLGASERANIPELNAIHSAAHEREGTEI